MNDKEMVRLEAGSVVALRMYDLGRALDLDAIAASARDSERPQFPDNAGDGLRYARQPVEIALDDVELNTESGRLFADATVRVFDFGIAAVALRVLVGGLEWDRFTERVEEIGAATSSSDGVWEDVVARLRRALKTMSFEMRGEPVAKHTFVIARRFGAPLGVDELIGEDYAASLVSSEWRPLTTMARADLMRGACAAGRDLAVIGAERTFIVEPVAGSGVPDAIEAALAQRAFGDLARAALTAPSVNGRRGSSARGVALGARDRLGRAEMLLHSERTGRLASMYAAARDRFRVGEAEASAERRIATIAGAPSTPIGTIFLVAIIAALVTAALLLFLG